MHSPGDRGPAASPKIRVAVIGSGPAGLMAATHLSAEPSAEVHVFEKRAGLGRKLLIAGSSGLNISHHLTPKEFVAHYEGWDSKFWSALLSDFSPRHWIDFIEKDLGLETFLGTSDRYFVKEMKASGLLKRWTEKLTDRGVLFHSKHELRDFREETGGKMLLSFKNGSELFFDFALFALGGASWENEIPEWAELFSGKGIRIQPFSPRNVGYEVAWKPEFLKEAEGKPLKKIRFASSRGEKDGELVITAYGLEGTPVYFFGETGTCFLDLKPDLDAAKVRERLESVKENLAPIRRAKQKLGLCEGSLALLFHHLPPADRQDLGRFAAAVKRFPIQLKQPRPLSESISSAGGVALSEVTPELGLKRFPNAYCAGEMLDWDAPTGGFLIQAAVSTGARAARSILRAGCSPNRRPS